MSAPVRLAWLALALMPGCGPWYLEPSTDPGEESLRVDDINPAWGPTTGRTEVAITGAGFSGDVAVRFGNSAGDVTVVDENNLTVLAPDAEGMAITVDVIVTSRLGEVTVEDGFAYSDDTPPDTDDTSGEVDGVGGIVEFSHLQIACPQCFGDTSPKVGAFAAFHQPVDGTWTSWLPDPGTCVQNPDSPQPTSSFLDVGQNVFLTAGSRSIGLTRTTVGGQVQYDAGALADADFARNTSFDLEAADGGGWGPFIVDDVLTTGQMITSITQPDYTPQPLALLYTTPSTAFERGLLHYPIYYSPYGGEGTFVVLLDFYSSDGSSFIGEVVCRDYDNGTFTLHEAYASAFPARSLVAVFMFRYLIAWTPNEASGSYIESAVSIGVLGTASI
jgi:hypothetical protein